MINIYKFGGLHIKTDGTTYSVKTINESEKSKYILKGWVSKLSMVEYVEEAVFKEVKEPAKQKTVKPKPVKKV